MYYASSSLESSHCYEAREEQPMTTNPFLNAQLRDQWGTHSALLLDSSKPPQLP